MRGSSVIEKIPCYGGLLIQEAYRAKYIFFNEYHRTKTHRIMDPLSIIAGVLAIGGGIGASLEVLKKIRDAPREMQALLKEAADLEASVEHVEATLSATDCGMKTERLTNLTKGVKDTVQSFHKFVDSLQLKDKVCHRNINDRNFKISSIRCIRARRRILSFKNEINGRRKDLGKALLLSVFPIGQDQGILTASVGLLTLAKI